MPLLFSVTVVQSSGQHETAADNRLGDINRHLHNHRRSYHASPGVGS